jgi:hypothetical protein
LCTIFYASQSLLPAKPTGLFERFTTAAGIAVIDCYGQKQAQAILSAPTTGGHTASMVSLNRRKTQRILRAVALAGAYR